MKGCTRSTLGVIIGAISIVLNIGLIIFAIVSLLQIHEIKQRKLMNFDRDIFLYILVIVFGSIVSIFSVFMIIGIVKRRHELMTPWMLLSATTFIYNCGQFAFDFFGILFSGNFLSIAFMLLFVNLLGIVISSLILWVIFILYGDIRRENNEKSGEILKSDIGIEYQKQHNYNI